MRVIVALFVMLLARAASAEAPVPRWFDLAKAPPPIPAAPPVEPPKTERPDVSAPAYRGYLSSAAGQRHFLQARRGGRSRVVSVLTAPPTQGP